ncbi:hypothetical protein BDV40DRAFT_302910 [Aspergillus tamarii]|uniref:Uncharacterized protein n=1 Tax=Aspergillus tamarii TaxID=41984 RepID=A0A5N6UNW3_ASPTM|nr:hypothetical protein BDV40DRAFT_302910 [Aspergillus tamarii]
MKFTVISVLMVAFLSVGPVGAIPVDSIQDVTTADAVSRTDYTMPSGPSATLTYDKSHHFYTHDHGQRETEDADPSTDDAISQTDGAMPADASPTLASHKLDHNCTDAHVHEKFEHGGPTTTATASASDGEMKAWVRRAPASHSTPDSTEAQRAGSAEISSPGSEGNSPGSEGNSPGSEDNSPGSEDNSPSSQADNSQDDKWIHGTCKQDKCTVTMPGENRERKTDCHADSPCLYLGSCVVSARNPDVAFCS